MTLWQLVYGTVGLLLALGVVSLVPSRHDSAEDRVVRVLAGAFALTLAGTLWGVARLVLV